MDRIINIGSRSSSLALIQTEYVVSQLKIQYPGQEFNLVTMKTIGDKILEKPLPEIGDKGLFTQELEEALLSGKVDFIVHSLKDLPTTLPEGCVIGAILEREDPRDVLVLKEEIKLDNPIDLLMEKYPSDKPSEKKCVIGTSSLRRRAQLKRLNPNLDIVDIRGNITTRLDKLDGRKGDVKYDALILALSGLTRGGYGPRVSHILSSGKEMSGHSWMYAVGQGALAIEVRSGDQEILDFLQPLLDQQTIYECLAERSLLFHLEGGCSVPIGVTTTWETEEIVTLNAAVFSLDGERKIEGTDFVEVNRKKNVTPEDDDESSRKKTRLENEILVGFLVSTDCPVLRDNYRKCFQLGRRLATSLLEQGADSLLREIKVDKEKRMNETSDLLNSLTSSEESTSIVVT